MTSPKEIRELAKLRIEEAKILFDNKKYDGAFYLAGYSIELTLKAKICERFCIPDLFAFDEKTEQNNDVKEAIREIKKTIKTHNLKVLLVLSGLITKLEDYKITDIETFNTISIVLSLWSEEVRYKPN